jgi:DnaK suppressor protein
MAKARTSEKSSSRKTEEKKPVKASASEKSKASSSKASSSGSERAPAPKAAASAPPPAKNERKASPSGAPGAPTTMANDQPIPDATQVRAHPDAKLSKQEIQGLYQKLIDERNRVLSGFDRHVSEALEDGDVLADEIDIAQRSTDQAWLFRFADKERKLLIEIEAALQKMSAGEYGLCEGTDEPIGFKRLELRPWTRYSVGYKELLEREKAQHTR